ncbi:hypothetical protein [Candidatus Leptofilum sp.]|uniref:hypothetical protein n=1 Tax=Candidatus Leptofilum sp. TaxID=3241576 RepID=UPI003B599FD0
MVSDELKLRRPVWLVILFMVAIGMGLGMVGGLVERTAVTVIVTAVMLAIFGAYERVLKHNYVLMSGLLAGGFIGLIVGGFGYWLGGNVTNLLDGTLFGLLRGIIVGAVVGGITRAQSDEGDSWRTNIFLLMGSLLIGAILGASVGLISGFVLGLVRWHDWGAWVVMPLGAIVAGYLGTYFQRKELILASALLGGLLTLFSSFMGGAVAGVVLGMITGALAPMLLMALIGAGGGLTSRGVKAMLVEAVEAPAEMLQQGAFPFLAPAVIVGVIVGTAASGASGLIALPLCLAVLGILLAVFSEVDGRIASKLNARTLVEMVILGAEDLPIMAVPQKLMSDSKAAVLGALFGLTVGGISTAIGAWLIQQLF